MRVNLSALEAELLAEFVRDEQRKIMDRPDGDYLLPVALMDFFEALLKKLGGDPE